MPSLREVLARPAARVLCALAGAALLAVVVFEVGAREVLLGLGRAVWCLPELAALEATMLCCSTWALRSLYGSEAALNPVPTWVKAATLGYVVSLAVPLGRAAAEGTRAVILRPGVGGPRAAVAAVQMQGVVLLANSLVVSLIVLAAVLPLFGPGWLAATLLGGGLFAGVLGISILVVRERARPGRLFGSLTGRGRSFGLTFDAVQGTTGSGLARAMAWESAARALLGAQVGVALGALGHSVSPRMTFVAQAITMVGGAVGDVLPAQLGATEAALTATAATLGMTAVTASAVALLIHSAQLLLAFGCGATGLAMPSGRPASAASADLQP